LKTLETRILLKIKLEVNHFHSILVLRDIESRRLNTKAVSFIKMQPRHKNINRGKLSRPEKRKHEEVFISNPNSNVLQIPEKIEVQELGQQILNIPDNLENQDIYNHREDEAHFLDNDDNQFVNNCDFFLNENFDTTEVVPVNEIFGGNENVLLNEDLVDKRNLLTHKYYTVIDCTSPGFSVKAMSLYFLKKLLSPPDYIECKENNKKLYGRDGVSMGSFARAFTVICNDQLITSKTQEKLINFFQNACPILNLPVLKITNDENDSVSVNTLSTIRLLEITNVRSDFKRYNEAKESQRFVSISQCVNDCFVFAGEKNGKKLDCNSCGLPRFRPCVRSTCSGRGTTKCEHLIKYDGVPNKQLFYRPLLLLIADLLRTPHFLTSLNHSRLLIKADKDCYTDIMDGSVPQKHLKQMEDRFLLNYAKKERM
jgi:hypothetical protein